MISELSQVMLAALVVASMSSHTTPSQEIAPEEKKIIISKNVGSDILMIEEDISSRTAEETSLAKKSSTDKNPSKTDR